jgi:hypothetical protein
MNAVTHGVFCQEIILVKEDEPLYKDLRRQFIRDLKPQRMIEMQMVDKIVECTWKQRRLRVSEATQYEIELREELAEKGTTWEEEMARKDPADYCAPVAMTRMLQRDEANLEHYSRLDQRLQNMIHRCLKELRTLQESAQKTADLPDSPFEETVDKVEYKWPTGWNKAPVDGVADPVLPEAGSATPPTGTEEAIAQNEANAESHARPSPLPSPFQGEGMKAQVASDSAEMQKEPTAFATDAAADDCDEGYPGGKVYSIVHRHVPGCL